jgi:para-aminobenzoate synthetase component 1
MNSPSAPAFDLHRPALPLVEALPTRLSAVEAFQRFSHLPHVVFFDSAAFDARLGRYSFVAADPFQWIEIPADGSDGLGALDQLCRRFHGMTASIPQLPPFQGGLAGLLSYDLNRSLERIALPRYQDFAIPAMAVGAYDVVLAFDHVADRAWLISQGFPETDSQARLERAKSRRDEFKHHLECTATPAAKLEASRLEIADIAPQFETTVAGVTSTFSADAYRQAVRRAVEYIYAGDIFQVNLSQRLLHSASACSLDLYLRLRERNPAPYAGYLDLGDWQICSASPECFLTVRDGEVETRPIKGTRGRSHLPEADLFTGDDLSASEKDRAENVMIVDLMRNDLSRVCTADSVHVAQLCRLETYAFVKHLVSVVRGTLTPDRTPIDLLRASFPGGSITGAPKVHAMEIIAELEPTARGAYCGSLAYLGFDGQMDASILIRTITAGRGWWQLPVGGGIVAQSDPEDEYRETWHKARGLLKAIV